MTRGEPRVVTPALLRAWALPSPGSDKHARGRVVLVGGSGRTAGATRLGAEATLRAGAGKVTVATVAGAVDALAVAVPEAAVVGLGTDSDGGIDTAAAPRIVEEAEGADVLLAGTGFVDPEHAVALLADVVPRVGSSVVLDALGSAYLTEHPEGLAHLRGRAVLSVNPDELARTAHADDGAVEQDPAAVAARVAARSGVVVLCGGTEKHVVTPDGDVWVVEGGGPGLAASGSGDVQAGVVAGLLARGADPAQAAVWGGYVHARCGERLAAAIGPLGYLARELPAQVPAVLAELA